VVFRGCSTGIWARSIQEAVEAWRESGSTRALLRDARGNRLVLLGMYFVFVVFGRTGSLYRRSYTGHQKALIKIFSTFIDIVRVRSRQSLHRPHSILLENQTEYFTNSVSTESAHVPSYIPVPATHGSQLNSVSVVEAIGRG
jgi:hypothetical protein